MLKISQYLLPDRFIPDTEIDALRQLTQQYPWFSLAQQLLLVAYKQNNLTDQYNQQLFKTALYTLKRKRLHSFLVKTTIYKTQQSTFTKLSDQESVNVSDYIDNEPLIDIIDDETLLNFSNEYFSLDSFDDTEEQVEESKQSLIDRFIRDNPRIIPQASTHSMGSSDSMIQLEEDEQNEPVSEMLAQIYAAQGLNDLAISCYEKLSLLFPEKNTYFASLISQLKNKK